MITDSLSVPVGGGAVDTNDEHKLAKEMCYWPQIKEKI